MRLVCIHPARDPVTASGAMVTVGSAAGNDLVTVGADACHATIKLDRRGLVLDVQPGCQRVYVNARAVRERALLRYGDALTVGAQKFVVATDQPPVTAADAGAGMTKAVRASLRIVSGVASGQVLAVQGELRLGAGSRHFCDLAYGCRVTQGLSGLEFASDSATPRVNGWHCKSAMLAAGDQITLGEHRLVVEAPGLEYASHVALLPPAPPPPAPVAVEDDSPHTEVWWLIGAALLLAALIAMFLYFRW